MYYQYYNNRGGNILAQAMVSTSTIYNYADININSFPIDRTGATTTNYESDYLFSGLYICQKIASTIKSYPTTEIINGQIVPYTYPRSFTINNPTTNIPFFSVTVSDYCKQYPGLPNFNFRMVFVRPYTTSPSTSKLRTIIINDGIFSDISNWANLYHIGVHDFLMRGYAVAYIENVASNLDSRYGTLFGQSLYTFWNFGTHGCATNDLTKQAYASTQSAVAAAKYLAGKENEYGVDKNQIYAIGHSFGSPGIYGLGYAKQTDFPNMSTTNACTSNGWAYPLGLLDNITLDSYKTQTYALKSIGIYGGTFPTPSNNQLNIFDPTDKNIPAIIFHGANDPNLNIAGGTGYYSVSAIKAQFITNSIPLGGYVTCNGGHEVVTYNGMPDNPSIAQNTNLTSGDVNFIKTNNFLDNQYVGKPYTTASVAYFNDATYTTQYNTSHKMYLSKYVFFGKQVHDICRATALYFNFANICSSTSNINTCMSTANPTLYNNFLPAKTIDFPFVYPNNSNGFFTAGTCSTLVNLVNPQTSISTAKISREVVEFSKSSTNNFVNIYPLPANDIVNINFGIKSTGNVTISIFDMIGKNITTVINDDNIEQGQYLKQLNIANFPNGIYKLTMKTSDGEFIIKSIVIQK